MARLPALSTRPQSRSSSSVRRQPVQTRPRALWRSFLNPDSAALHGMRWYTRMGRRVWFHEMISFFLREVREKDGMTVRAFLGAAQDGEEEAHYQGHVDGDHGNAHRLGLLEAPLDDTAWLISSPVRFVISTVSAAGQVCWQVCASSANCFNFGAKNQPLRTMARTAAFKPKKSAVTTGTLPVVLPSDQRD